MEATLFTEQQALEYIFSAPKLTSHERYWKHQYKNGKLTPRSSEKILGLHGFKLHAQRMWKR